MARETRALSTDAATSPIDPTQTLRAATALLSKLTTDLTTRPTPAKTSLLADADDDATLTPAASTPLWLILTTKKHIVDAPRLKPGKIALPHPLTTLTSPTAPRICLLTADPQRKYKDLLASPACPPAIANAITRVLGMEKLKKKYASFESRRQLADEYDLFLADDRIVTYLPQLLGKVFYKSSTKRPVPVSLEGKRQNVDAATGTKRARLSEGGSKVAKAEPRAEDVAAELSRAVGCALVHLAPAATTAVRVGRADMSAQQVQENVAVVVQEVVQRFVPGKWRGVKAVHVKGPETAALPVWLAGELWVEEADVLDVEPKAQQVKEGKKRKAGLLDGAVKGEQEVLEVPGPDGKMRRLEKGKSVGEDGGVQVSVKAAKKRKSEPAGTDAGAEEAGVQKAAEKAERAARKEALREQKAAAKKNAAAAVEEAAEPQVAAKKDAASVKKSKTTRAKAADLI